MSHNGGSLGVALPPGVAQPLAGEAAGALYAVPRLVLARRSTLVIAVASLQQLLVIFGC